MPSIDYLANHTAFIPEIADLSYTQWMPLFQQAGISQAQLEELLTQRAVTDRLPITLVAIENGVLLGTGSIKLTEPGTREGLSPWLAGIYVKESERGTGLGAKIVRALESKAAELGVRELYLSAGQAEPFYVKLGWTVIEHLASYGVKNVALMTKQLT